MQALVNITDQQIYCDLVAGEEDNSFLKEWVLCPTNEDMRVKWASDSARFYVEDGSRQISTLCQLK